MGHPRRAKDAPSPVELLAIFQAKESGVSLPEISRRTKYSISSIIRWYEKWGKETVFTEAVACEAPSVARDYTFDVLYPESELQGTFELAEPPSIDSCILPSVPSLVESSDDFIQSQVDEQMKAHFGDAFAMASDDPTHRHQGQSPDEWDEQ